MVALGGGAVHSDHSSKRTHALTCTPNPNQYSISASIMSIALGIVVGIREQNTLASLFMLCWATQTYGFLTQ